MWNFRCPGGSGTEQPSSGAMPARDVLPVSHSPLFLWRATPISFSGREREMGLHKRADEYPRGAGRICNAPSSRTAALGIGPYNHDRKCGTRSKKRADRVVRPYKRCGVNRKSGQSVCPCNTKTQPSSIDGCVLIWDVIRPSVCRKSSCAWAARPRRWRPRACAAAPSAPWSASSASRRRR